MARDIETHHKFTHAENLGASSFDMNNARTSGLFECDNPTNGPGSGSWFVEILVSNVDGVIFQIATKKDRSEREYRIYNGSSWGSWTADAALGVDADNVTVEAISGVTGTDLQTVLEDLKAQIDTKADA